ncbi:hypothetical protein TVAG_045720 [Trichomonas vaginalis G3]|uniref:DUF3447 domain-containing protein n=1 Tax=Trichomonas vaginalis (strain ATCC PRA-98 / G3) TaxID=412133 RepID=A2DME3_TRIV3|nr:spectrin binding [Trichomonas vaginalis G3]EAY18370.1 hypothetical protein TVAG_045720 [Trichomonas vaginalis G3]KAI5524165.1 spectrin binding [Trichomonas vaginalis G3]|eukprot:XP_001579356.1 hypothetical protein [Trichomonas vaginalis G3]
MSNQYFDLRRIYGYYIDTYNAIYRLTTENEEELNKIYQMIGTNLINKRRYLSKTIIRNILNIIPYKNRYTKFYLELAKCIYDEYHVKEVKGVSAISNYLFYKEFRIQLETSYIFEEINTDNLAIHTEDSIYRAIMYNDLKIFIAFTEKEGFDIDQRLNCDLYPTTSVGYSLLELCCYHGAVDCFKFLLTKFKSRITQKCLQLSFLSGKPDILNECLKYRKPDNDCMMYAIISHNIDFVTFLMNEFNIEINLEICGFSQNLESFLVYFDQTNDINRCFAYSAMFFIPSLCEYFLSHDAIIEEKGEFCKTNLYYAAENNSNKIAELLKPDYANIKKKDVNRKNALHIAAEINSKEITKLRISYGANINEIDDYGETALHIAALNNSKETAKLLLSYRANFFKKIDLEEQLFIMQHAIIVKRWSKFLFHMV